MPRFRSSRCTHSAPPADPCARCRSLPRGRGSTASVANSSPYPAWSVRASPPTSTTVRSADRRAAARSPARRTARLTARTGRSRNHTRRRLNTSETISPTSSSHRENQRPHLRRIERGLQRHPLVEPGEGDLRAVVEGDRLAHHQVGPRLLGQQPLVDLGGVDGEHRLRAAALHAQVAAVDVDGDAGVVRRRERRRHDAAVHERGRREDPDDRQLLFADVVAGGARAGRGS